MSDTPSDLSAKRRAASLARKTHSPGKNGGRPKGSISRKKRCPCGLMTARRAAARKHSCTAPEAVQAEFKEELDSYIDNFKAELKRGIEENAGKRAASNR